MSRQILNGWKEISNYIERGVRTAQRWEVCLGMPVHRPALKERSAVVAFTEELDRWLSRSPPDPVDANGERDEEALVRVHDNLKQPGVAHLGTCVADQSLAGAIEAFTRDSAQPDRIENAHPPRRISRQKPRGDAAVPAEEQPSSVADPLIEGAHQKVTKSVVTNWAYGLSHLHNPHDEGKPYLCLERLVF